MKKIILSVTNDLSNDQRVDKVANSLIDAGFQVLLIGRLKYNSIDLKTQNYQCIRWSLFFSHGFLFYMEFNIRLFIFLLISRCDILVANDLDTLLPNFLASKIRNKKLIYDSHELFSELPELLNRKRVKYVWMLLESLLLPRLKHSYTVSESIANYYFDKYDVNMGVVRNVPLYKSINIDMVHSSDFKKIIYQGAINKDRGISLMIRSMQYIDAKLYIYGSGDILDAMVNLVKALNLDSKVVFEGNVRFDHLWQFTRTADLGLSFEEDTCLAYRFSLPNKIFDYINAEIPILISDLPEFRKVISTYKVGEVLVSRETKLVASQINKLLCKPKSAWSENIKLAKKDFCWENEESNLLSFFEHNDI